MGHRMSRKLFIVDPVDNISVDEKDESKFEHSGDKYADIRKLIKQAVNEELSAPLNWIIGVLNDRLAYEDGVDSEPFVLVADSGVRKRAVKKLDPLFPLLGFAKGPDGKWEIPTDINIHGLEDDLSHLIKCKQEAESSNEHDVALASKNDNTIDAVHSNTNTQQDESSAESEEMSDGEMESSFDIAEMRARWAAMKTENLFLAGLAQGEDEENINFPKSRDVPLVIVSSDEEA